MVAFIRHDVFNIVASAAFDSGIHRLNGPRGAGVVIAAPEAVEMLVYYLAAHRARNGQVVSHAHCCERCASARMTGVGS